MLGGVPAAANAVEGAHKAELIFVLGSSPAAAYAVEGAHKAESIDVLGGAPAAANALEGAHMAESIVVPHHGRGNPPRTREITTPPWTVET